MRKSARTDREPQSLGEKCSNPSEEGKAKREPQRTSVPLPGKPQPKTLRQGLGTEA